MKELITEAWPDYALLDSGNGRKLEQYGQVRVDRPEPQALWSPLLPASEWEKAAARFDNAGSAKSDDDDRGEWVVRHGKKADVWPMTVDNITLLCRYMGFRHLGVFPEQRPHWQWVSEHIKVSKKPLKIRNLFGYTGAASLAAAKAGAHVTHLDASKKAIQWARENQAASGLEQAPIRWICDDAAAFVAREQRRGSTYDGIILDPPKFGRGPDGEIWDFMKDIAAFTKDCTKILSPDAKFLILTAYALRLSSRTLSQILSDALPPERGGKLDHGELLIAQKGGKRYLSTSLFARWSAE